MSVSANLGRELQMLEPGAFMTDRTEIVADEEAAKELYGKRRNSIKQVAKRNGVKVDVEGLYMPYPQKETRQYIVTILIRRLPV